MATGSYFVSNYPPFPFWTEAALGEVMRHLQGPAGERPLGLYLHLPFCRRRCNFCYFKVYTDRNAAQVDAYVDALLQEWGLWREIPFFAGRQPRFVYFGGGTPSYLSVRQLKRLIEGLPDLAAAEEVAFEAEPGTLTLAKLAALKELGVTRLSLGVENFDDAVLEAGGRAHRSAEIGRAYGHAREVGFDQINIDLIAGMVGESEANWDECLRRTLELSPESVTVYQLEVPENTLMFRDGTAPPSWEFRRRLMGRAYDRLEEGGYTFTSAYTAVRDPQRTRFAYRDHLWGGADMLGLGVSAFSHAHGAHFQNERNIEGYLERVGRGELPLWRGYRLTDQERLLRELILQLKLGRVPRDRFGVDVTREFGPGLARISEFLLVEPTELRWTRPGLARIDELLRELFLERHR